MNVIRKLMIIYNNWKMKYKKLKISRNNWITKSIHILCYKRNVNNKNNV